MMGPHDHRRRASPWCRPSATPCATPCSQLGPDAPTLCDPWLTRDLAAHLVLRERRPDLATGMWFAPLKGRLERGQARIAAGDSPQLVETVRSGPPWWTPMHFAKVDALVNTSEFVIHHEDVLRGDGAVGPRREVPERTARAVLSALRRSASLMFRRCEVGVRLVAPGAEPITAGRSRPPRGAGRHGDRCAGRAAAAGGGPDAGGGRRVRRRRPRTSRH